MVRVQYARHNHVKIGFKGLKDNSYTISANNLNDSSLMSINTIQDNSMQYRNNTATFREDDRNHDNSQTAF